MVKVIQKHYCDRCGEEFDPQKLPYVKMDFAYSLQAMLSIVSDQKKDYELCPACAAEFINWKNNWGKGDKQDGRA